VKNWWKGFLVLALGLLGSGVILLASSPPRGNPVQLLPPPTPVPVQVHISGAVNQPGVYSFPANNRVQDAIRAAGGFTDDASVDSINLAALLQDGIQIWVPSLLQSQETDQGYEGQDNSGDERSRTAIELLININTAPQEGLETLPEIGPAIAEDIIEYRQTEGLFISIEEIQKVPGIGPATYDEIKGLITVGGP
jgi:competence protein ComEA